MINLRQFYTLNSTDSPDDVPRVEFEQPVRKINITATTDYLMYIDFSDSTQSSSYLIIPRFQCYFDFQSANNGGGIKSLKFRSYGKKGTIYISVIEYGTGGNNDWYK